MNFRFLTHVIISRGSPGYAGIIGKGVRKMNIRPEIGERAIQEVMNDHPEIGEILSRHDIGCVTCKVGICLVKDVVAIHGLSKETEAEIEAEIEGLLKAKGEER
jgi:hypothetical protein